MNDGIRKADAAVSYVTVQNFCEKILNLGQGAMPCKFDIKAAYRHVPVHPDDRYLLGFKWQGDTYGDLTLPMG